MEKDEFLKEAEQEALLGLREGGIPIGGVLSTTGKSLQEVTIAVFKKAIPYFMAKLTRFPMPADILRRSTESAHSTRRSLLVLCVQVPSRSTKYRAL